MRRLALTLALVSASASASAQVVLDRPDPAPPVPHYEQASHVKLVHRAFDILPAGPLRDELAANGMRFVGPEGGFGCGGGSDDGESLAEGAHEEDCGLRFLEHFWDADTDEGFGNSDDAYRHAEEMYREAVGLYLAGDRPSAWYRLGRVIHLLQDLCNPAHDHLDPHGAADPDNDFEQRADEMFESALDDGELVGLEPLDAHELPATPCPPRFADSPLQQQPFFRLFLHVAETADFFESGDVAGDPDCVGGGASAAAFAEAVGHGVGMAPPPSGSFSDEHLELHLDTLLPLAIRAGAGLLELFWSDTHEDADGDGLVDGADPCPDDAADDRDGDGVCAGERWLAPMLAAGDECPLETTLTEAGSCGCLLPDDPSDGDGDGVPDCVDLCPGEADPAQEDADGDGIGDACLGRLALGGGRAASAGERARAALRLSLGAACVDSLSLRLRFDEALWSFVAADASPGCAADASLAAPGELDLAVDCGAGLSGELEPAELVFEARQSAAGPLLSALVPDAPFAPRCSSGTLPVAAREGTLVLGCLPGDVDGDGLATLADLLASRDALAPACADLAPSTRGCAPLTGAAARCPAGDGSFGDEDRARLRALLAGVERASCESCDEPGEGALLRLPGDVAPAGGGDGRLGVADVLRVLRFAVGLETPTGEERLRAEVDGEGRLDVSDVVLVLRAAVQLVELVWPERELVLELDRPRTLSAWSVLVSGLPPWARASSSSAAGCPAGPFGGLDAAGGRAALTCAPAGPVALSGRIAVLRYRAPEPVEPGRLSVTARALDAAGSQVVPEVSVGLP